MNDPVKPIDSFVPVQPDPDGVVIHSCQVPEGGTKTVKAPKYVLTITNPVDE